MQKRIGIIMGKAYKEINRQQLCGILDEAYPRGISAFVFTLTEENDNTSIITGEENLFNLINFSMLSGIVFLPYTFSSTEYCDYIQRFLQKHCTLPVVRIGTEQEPFSAIWFRDRDEVKEITEHLIRDHGCRKLICLTGQDFQQVSHERAAGFLEAMEKAGLPAGKESVIFGDFWVYSARELAKEISEGNRPMPDGIVCANDTMAIALYDALNDYGIRVPEQIRITGYDGTLESEIHVPPITTYRTSWRQLGRSAFCQLWSLISGEKARPRSFERGKLLTRESCGCKSELHPASGSEFNYQQLEDHYLDTNLSTRLLSCNNLDSFVKTMYDCTFVFAEPEYYGREDFLLCLCTDWDQADGDSNAYRTWGYSTEMTAMNYLSNHQNFPLEKMLPDGFIRTPGPSVTFFTSVHFLDRCFGYAVLNLSGVIDSFNAHYLRFCREVNNALEFLRVQNALRSLAYHNLLTQVRDTLTGLYNLRSLPHIWDDHLRLLHAEYEKNYWIALSIGGLYRLTEAYGSLEKDKLLVSFAELLQNACSHGEKCLHAGEGDFIVLGREPQSSYYHNLLIQNVREQFEQYQTALGQPLLPLQYAVLLEDQVPANAEAAEKTAEALLEQAKSVQPTYSEQLHYADLAELRRNIYKYPERNWTLASCSEQLNISSSYFHRIYQKAFGVSCANDIHRSKLEHAKWLLLHTSDTLQEVARKCGYDYSHFMRTFKKEFGMTPTEYRRGKTE